MVKMNRGYGERGGPSGENTVRLRFQKAASGLVLAQKIAPTAHNLAVILGHEPVFGIDTGPQNRPWSGDVRALFRIATFRKITDIVVAPDSVEPGEDGFLANSQYAALKVDSYGEPGDIDRKAPTDRERSLRAAGPAFWAISIAEALAEFGPVEVLPKDT